jgi:hypothetical protein
VDKAAKLAEMILAGMRPSQARAEADREGWTVTDEELAGLLIDAQARIIEDARHRFDLELAKAIDRLNTLYARSMQIQDYKACLAIQKELNKILDLYARQQDQPEKPEANPDADEGDDMAELLKLAGTG